MEGKTAEIFFFFLVLTIIFIHLEVILTFIYKYMNVPCLDNNNTNGGCLSFIIVENAFKPSYCFILKYTHDQ